MPDFKKFAERFADYPEWVSTAQAADILSVQSTTAALSLIKRNDKAIRKMDLSAQDSKISHWVINKQDLLEFQFRRNPEI